MRKNWFLYKIKKISLFHKKVLFSELFFLSISSSFVYFLNIYCRRKISFLMWSRQLKFSKTLKILYTSFYEAAISFEVQKRGVEMPFTTKAATVYYFVFLWGFWWNIKLSTFNWELKRYIQHEIISSFFP